jgi:hypothetical protein
MEFRVEGTEWVTETEMRKNLYFRTVHVATLTLLKTNSCNFCKIHSHSHLKLQTVKNVCETHN